MASNSTEDKKPHVLPWVESEDEGESGAESFLTDDEMAYQEGKDPAEDLYDDEDAEEPSLSASSSEGEETKAQSSSPPQKRPRGRSPLTTCQQSWKTETDHDVRPLPKRFLPARPPGHQLNTNTTYTPLDLFKLFFNNDAVQTLCQNTNKKAVKNILKGKRYSWTNIETQEFFKYVGLTFFFALVKLDNIQDYWKKKNIFSVPFPANVMPRDRYRVISWNIHMSDPDKDIENDRKKGTPEYDRLFRLKPLMDTIKGACKTFYHPRQTLSIDERMVATKGRVGILQNMKPKPTKSGFKLFALSDGTNGYTWDFIVYTGKTPFPSGVGLAYDSVMSLIMTPSLGSGFHLYMDSFYTSPRLFKDLFSLNIGACGTYRDNRRDCPRTESNALTKKDPRGSIRWIRDGPLIFVKWKDYNEVSVCSTIHEAFTGSTTQRRIKSQNGEVTTKSIPCPTPVVEYNKHMGVVELTDQLVQYYSVHQKTTCWYRTLFFHFLDIAALNSFLLHKELCKEKHEQPMTQKAFLQELTAQLCGVTVVVPPSQAHTGHIPVPISDQPDTSRRASYGRRTCLHCRQARQVRLSTPWKCMECDVALCVIADRNCFADWHNYLLQTNLSSNN